MSYTAEYKKPYEGGWQDSPSKETPVMAKNLDNYDSVIMKIEEYLANTIKEDFAQLAEAGYSLGLDIDRSTYVMTISLKNKAGTVISSKSIDFPIESMIINATYADGTLTLTLQNGNVLDVDISAIVGGLVTDTRTIAGIDLKDDITAEELKEALAVPSKVSELENDAGYLTADDVKTDAIVAMGEIKPWLYDTSGEEVIIGVYGGKTLYRKSFTIDIVCGQNSTVTYALSDYLADCELILDYVCYDKLSQLSVPYTLLGSYSQYARSVAIVLSEDKIYYSCASASSVDNHTHEFIVEYTKTTDAEGSGEDLVPYGFVRKDFASTSDSHMPNSKAGGLEIERIAGGVEQQRYEGKQLIPFPYNYGDRTQGGVTFTTENGSIILNGTLTSGFGYRLISVSDNYILPAGTYTLSGINYEDRAYIQLRIYDWSSGGENYDSILATDGGEGVTFTIETDAHIELRLNLFSEGVDKAFENIIIKPNLEIGDTITAQEPWVGGTASPNVDYPQEIQNVDITEVKSVGKNVFDLSQYTDRTNKGVTATIKKQTMILNGTATDAGALPTVITKPLPFKAKVGDTLTISTTILSGSATIAGDTSLGFCVIRVNKEEVTRFAVRNIVSGKIDKNTKTKPESIVVTEDMISDDGFIHYTTQVYIRADDVYNNLVLGIQIELNSEATEYEPYKSSVSAPAITCRAIEVSESDAYTYEKDGKYYVADTIERTDDRYQLVQRIGECVFDGVNNACGYVGTNIQGAVETLTTFNLGNASFWTTSYKIPSNSGHFMCDKFTTVKNWAGASTDGKRYVARRSLDNGTVCCYVPNDFGITTIDEANTWLQSNPVTVHAELLTPIITPLSDADAIALLSLKTFNEATHITTNSVVEALIDVKYGISEVGARTLRADNTALRAEIRAKALEATAVNNI